MLTFKQFRFIAYAMTAKHVSEGGALVQDSWGYYDADTSRMTYCPLSCIAGRSGYVLEEAADCLTVDPNALVRFVLGFDGQDGDHGDEYFQLGVSIRRTYGASIVPRRWIGQTTQGGSTAYSEGTR